MIRKAAVVLLTLLGAGLLFVGWLGQQSPTFRVSSQIEVQAGRCEYRPADWPAAHSSQGWLAPTLHDLAGEWISLGVLSPKRTDENSCYFWADFSFTDKKGVQCRLRYLHIKQPVLTLASILLLLYPAICFLRGPVVRFYRRTKRQCMRCGYDLTGNLSGLCPECGLDRATHRKMVARNKCWTNGAAAGVLATFLGIGSWNVFVHAKHPFDYGRGIEFRLVLLATVVMVAFRKGRQHNTAKKPVRAAIWVPGVAILLLAAWASGLPTGVLTVFAVFAAYAYLPSAVRRCRAVSRLKIRPVQPLETQYEEIVQRGGMERSEIECLWRDLTEFYEIPPTLIQVSDKLTAELAGIVGHPGYELFFFEPKLLADRASQQLLERMVDWGDLIIGVHQIRSQGRAIRSK